MDGLNISMSWENVRINIKDVLQIVSFVVVAAFFFSAQSSKIDGVIQVVQEMKAENKEKKQEDKEAVNENRIATQQMLNQINTNSIEIKIIQQKVLQLEAKSK